MIIDANAWLGQWPFRQLRHNDVDGLLRLMDANGIDKAVVSSIHGIFYKNCQRANEELAEAVSGCHDRLLSFATLNPHYPGWERNLQLCRNDLGMRGLRVFPAYHQYDLTDGPSLEMIAAASELGWPVTITQRVVDVRQRHPMDTERLIGVAEFEAVVAACPQTSFIILNALGLEGSAMFAGNREGGRQVMTDISRMTAVMGNSMGVMVEKYGAGSLVFGTGFPFNYPRPALLKMDVLQADAATKEAIYHGNLERLLRL